MVMFRSNFIALPIEEDRYRYWKKTFENMTFSEANIESSACAMQLFILLTKALK